MILHKIFDSDWKLIARMFESRFKKIVSSNCSNHLNWFQTRLLCIQLNVDSFVEWLMIEWKLDFYWNRCMSALLIVIFRRFFLCFHFWFHLRNVRWKFLCFEKFRWCWRIWKLFFLIIRRFFLFWNDELKWNLDQKMIWIIVYVIEKIIKHEIEIIHQKADVWLNDEIDLNWEFSWSFTIAFDRLHDWWFDVQSIRWFDDFKIILIDKNEWNLIDWIFWFFFCWLKTNCALSSSRHSIDDTIWWWWFWIVLIFEKILWWLFHFSNRKICMIFFMHLFNFRCFYEKSKFLNSTKNFVLKLLTIRFEYWMHFWFDVMRCVFWFHSLFFS